MKKTAALIIAAVLAACLLNRQTAPFVIKAGGETYELYFKNDTIFYLNGLLPKKLSEEKILSYKIYDIDSDKNDELLIITKSPNDGYGKDLVIYDTEASGKLRLIEIFRQDFSGVKPWKVDACNLDNDGETDIFVGVYKDTVFYKDFRKRPFFYSWNGKKLSKKWLGSFFTDWELVDISFGDYFNTGCDAAAVLEKSRNGEYRVSIYNFIGFGFEHMKTVNIDGGDITDLRIKEILKED